MSNQFSADEILEIARQIEQNGIKFYGTAADCVENPQQKQLLLDLAGWEVSHVETFAKMREGLAVSEKQPTVFDPDDEIGLYLKAMADRVIFTSQMKPEEMLCENPTYRHILEVALDREKDAVVFYASVRDLVPERLGREKIDEIMQEEVYHVALIEKQIRELGD
jgi:rubrerythrin